MFGPGVLDAKLQVTSPGIIRCMDFVSASRFPFKVQAEAVIDA